MKIIKSIFKVIKYVMTVLLIVMAAFLLIVKFMGDTPSIFGYSMYYIVTPSMEPTLEVGDVILSKKVDDVNKLEIGDVITYQGEVDSYAGKLITHQIIDIKEVNGELEFITKGTKEGALVDPPVRSDQIRSIMVFEIPLLGKVIQIINTPIGFMILLVTPLGVCLISEIVNLFKIIFNKDEEKGDEEDEKNVK